MAAENESPIEPVKGCGPIPEEVDRITNAIIQELGSVDMESALTVICNLAGQVVAALAEGQPSAVRRHCNNVAEHVKTAALIKLLHDTNERQRADREKQRANED